jgi:hypothetical protein
LQLRTLLLHIVVMTIIALIGSRSFAAEQTSDVPAWLQAHIGEGEGQIAQVVLQRARALYLQKVSEGAAKNPWTRHAPAGSAGFTLSVKRIDRFAWFRLVAAEVAI